MAAAVVGGGLKAGGVEVPAINTLDRQLLAFGLGLAMIVLGLSSRWWHPVGWVLRTLLRRQPHQMTPSSHAGITATREDSSTARGGEQLSAGQARAAGARSQVLQTIATSGGVHHVAFSPDGRLLAAGLDDGVARIWEPATGLKRLDLQLAGTRITSVVFNPDGRWLATGGGVGTFERVFVDIVSPGPILVRGIATIWDVASGQQLVQLAHSRPVRCLAFSPNKRWLATGSDQYVRIWDTADGHEVERVGGRKVYSVLEGVADYVPITPVMLVGRLRKYSRRPVVEGRVDAVAFSPDGRCLATGSNGFTRPARIWDTADWHELVQLRHAKRVTSAAFNPIGRWLATASGEIATIWDVASGQELVRVDHDERVASVAFSPNGRWLATASGEIATIWDVAGQELVRVRHEKPVTSVAFSPDDGRLAVASYQQVRVLKVE